MHPNSKTSARITNPEIQVISPFNWILEQRVGLPSRHAVIGHNMQYLQWYRPRPPSSHFRAFKAPFPYTLPFDTYIQLRPKVKLTRIWEHVQWKVPLWQQNWALHIQLSLSDLKGKLAQTKSDILQLLCAKFKLGCLDKAPNMPEEGKWALWPNSPAY